MEICDEAGSDDRRPDLASRSGRRIERIQLYSPADTPGGERASGFVF
jgi:hypothetical protein